MQFLFSERKMQDLADISFFNHKKVNKKRDELRLLLLQNRDHDFVRKDEHRVFALHSGLDISQISVLNAFDTPQYPLEILQQYDGLLVGGASEVSVNAIEKHPFLEREKELLLFAAEKNIPTFCSCFGFQLAIQAFGGTIFKEKKTCEMASIPISLAESAQGDTIFADVPDDFLAISVHQEKAIELPENLELLAYTDVCCHAFKVKEKSFWAFQFHPEIDLETLQKWLTIYCGKYTCDQDHLKKTLTKFTHTPHAHKLIRNFVDLVVCES